MNQQVKAIEIKGVALENFKNNMANDLFGMTKAEAQAQELCISCKKTCHELLLLGCGCEGVSDIWTVWPMF